MARGIKFFSLFALAFVSALVIFASATDTKAATKFDPGARICLETFQWGGPTEIDPKECDGNPAAGAQTDARVRFCVGYPEDCSGGLADPKTVTDSNFGGVAGLTPPLSTAGKDLPIGAVVGRLSSNAVLGVLGNPCNLNIFVSFTLLNGSLDLTDTAAPRGVGEANQMLPLASDTGEIGKETGTKNGIPRGTEQYPQFLKYQFDPDLDAGADRLYGTADDKDSDGGVNIAPQQPVLRLSGFTMVQNTWVSLQFLAFPPGAILRGPNNYPVKMDPALGFVTATVLQNPTAPAEPSAISDFCAPLRVQFVTFGTTYDNPCTPLPAADKQANCPGGDPEKPIQTRGYPMLPCETLSNLDEDKDGKVNDGCPRVNSIAETGAECADAVSNDPEDTDVNDGCTAVGQPESLRPTGGACTGLDEGGCKARTNPAQSYNVITYTRSLKDADGDGIETVLDVCWDKANPNWKPRDFDAVNDSDLDGLPTECDPDPNVSSPPSLQACPAGNIGSDEDGDCFSNRADNCPLNNQLKDPTKPPTYHKPPEGPLPTDNIPQIYDDDGDFIGNACEAAGQKDIPNGAFLEDCLSFAIPVGAGASTAAVKPTHARTPDLGGTGGDPANDGSCAFTAYNPADPFPELRNAPATATPVGQTPAPTPIGQTPPPGGVCTGPGCEGDPGIGSLAPTGADVPAWAAVFAGLGGAGVIAALGILGSRLVRVRRRE